MALSVIGAGLGRTGTLSLKHALEQLGVGRCHHMLEVAPVPERVATWTRVATGEERDWDRVFEGFGATVDWPSATYWRELAAYYPDAKVILTVRDSGRWFESTQATIFSEALRDQAPPPMRTMVERTVFAMFDGRIHDREHAIDVFERHNRAVLDAIAPERLLVFEPAQGWEPLCAFLGRPVPDAPFPRTNSAEELWEAVARFR